MRVEDQCKENAARILEHVEAGNYFVPDPQQIRTLPCDLGLAVGYCGA